MPGFDLAKAAAEVFEQDTSVEGLILDKHGIFTFGETAREAYDRMIDSVTAAEDYIAKGTQAQARRCGTSRQARHACRRSRRCCAALSPSTRARGASTA